LANYHSVSHAFGFAASEVALFEALRAWEVGGGDEVIVSACVPRCLVEAILRVGATPIFTEVERDTFNLDSKRLDDVLTKRARVLVISHAFGQAANLAAIVPWARGKKIKVVEDCSHALGARYRGELLGTFGDAALFSFDREGSLGAVGGGAIATSDPHLGRALETVRRRLPFPPRRVVADGLLGREVSGNVACRLPNVWAAVAYHRLVGVDERNRHRREVAGCYLQRLQNMPPLKLPRVERGAEPSFRYFAIRVPDPDRLLRAARGRRVAFVRGCAGIMPPPKSCPAAVEITAQAVLLPTSIPLARAERVIRAIREHYQPGADR